MVKGHERRRLRDFYKINQQRKPSVSLDISNKHIRISLHSESGNVITGVYNKKPSTNINEASKLGEEMAEKIKKLNIQSVVFNKSGFTFHGKVKAIAESLRKGGVIC